MKNLHCRNHRLASTSLLSLALALMTLPVQAQAPGTAVVDILLKGGTVIDGTGSSAMREDVAITGDRIVYIGRAPVRAKRTINVTGKVVTPGFIDMHVHSEFGLSLDGRGLSKITQGVTTEVMGEHMSAGPVLGHAVDDLMMIEPPVHRTWTTLGGFFAFLAKKGIGPNVLSYVGAGQVRASVIGYSDRPATPVELAQEEALVRQAMEEGAFGLSSGLAYVPNAYSSTQELVALAKVAGSYGGIYTTHIRPGDGGLDEAISIARAAGIPTEIFHLNSSSGSNSAILVEKINAARETGLDITANAYPYTGSWTYLRVILPTWAQEGNADVIVARLKIPANRERAIAEMTAASKANPGRWDHLYVSSANLEFDGFSVQELATKRQTNPAGAVIDAIIDSKVGAFFVGDDDPKRDAVVRTALAPRWVDIGSDGIALPPGVHTAFGKPHPRSYGTHARILGEYVREEHQFPLEEAVRKMTSQAANRLGIADRGLLRQGMMADVVVFDPKTVRDRATRAKPEQFADGVYWVFINGAAVVANGKPTNALPGRILRGPGYKPQTP